MGGIGSGRPGGTGRNTVESCRSLDVNRLQRTGCLEPGRARSWQWTRDGERVAWINLRADADRLHLWYRVRLAGEEWQDVHETVGIDVTGSFWTVLIERVDLEQGSLRWPEGSGSAPSRSSPRCVRLRCSWHRVKAWPLPVRRPASPSRVVIGAWRDHYNRIRPHSALGYRPPAPVTRAFAHHLPTPNTMQ